MPPRDGRHSYSETQRRSKGRNGKVGKDKDRSTVHYNHTITVRGIRSKPMSTS
jgi:hypothetical protein